MIPLRNVRHLLVAGLVAFCSSHVSPAHSQEKDQGTFRDLAYFQAGCLEKRPGDNERFLFLRLDLNGNPTAGRLASLRRHLEQKDSYSATSDWTGVDGLVQVKGENPPFVVKEVSGIHYDEPGQVLRICLLGKVLSRARGEVHVKNPPEGWELKVEDRKDLAIAYERGSEAPEVPPVRGKVSLGFGSGGSSVDLNVSRALRDLLGSDDPDSNTVWTAAFSAKLPVGRPNDSKAAGANPDGSGKTADALSLDLNRYAYDPKSGASRFGFRARSSGSGEGGELTTYYAPFAGHFSGGHGFYGAEGEVGYREGNNEFKTVTVKAPDRGNLVARLGGVAEWAPQLGGINRDLSRGLRFFVRGRGWLDVFDNDQGKRSVRFAPFLDSELFYNFEADSRVFLRLEYGSLPPDLTRRISRIFVGVGQAF